MNDDCKTDCPASTAAHARRAIDEADKATLIHAIRALATMKLWDMPEAELRSMLHAAISERAFQDFEVLAALKGGA